VPLILLINYAKLNRATINTGTTRIWRC